MPSGYVPPRPPLLRIKEGKRGGEPTPISKRGGALIEYFAGLPSLHLTHLSCSSVRPPPSRCCGRSGAAPATSPRGRAASRRARGGSTTAESGNQRRRRRLRHRRRLLRGGAASPGSKENEIDRFSQNGEEWSSDPTWREPSFSAAPGFSRGTVLPLLFPLSWPDLGVGGTMAVFDVASAIS